MCIQLRHVYTHSGEHSLYRKMHVCMKTLWTVTDILFFMSRTSLLVLLLLSSCFHLCSLTFQIISIVHAKLHWLNKNKFVFLKSWIFLKIQGCNEIKQHQITLPFKTALTKSWKQGCINEILNIPENVKQWQLHTAPEISLCIWSIQNCIDKKPKIRLHLLNLKYSWWYKTVTTRCNT